jgi:hypothetical protein
MSEPMKYELVTIKDIFDTVPADKIELCMAEIAKAMVQSKAVIDLLGAVASETGGAIGAVEWSEKCTWVDDDKGITGCDIVARTGEKLMSYRAAPEGGRS